VANARQTQAARFPRPTTWTRNNVRANRISRQTKAWESVRGRHAPLAPISSLTMVFAMRLRTLIIVAVTALLLSGAYLAAAHLAPPDLAVGPQDRSYRLNIGEEEPVVKTLQAREGDRITFIVTSTRGGQFYIHGPEVESTLLPGVETSVTFTAQYAGRYYVHLHQIICISPDDSDVSHTELAVLDVMPN
jgi:hypothetical protein